MLTDKAKEIIDQTEGKMQEALKFLEEDLKTYRVGKANPAIFNGVTIDYYGTPTALHQVASISAPDAKTLALQPWEKNPSTRSRRRSSTPTSASPRRITAR